MNVSKEDFNPVYQEARKAFDVLKQKKLPDEALEEAKRKLIAFLPYLDYLIYQYPEDKFPYHLYRVRQEQAISEDESIREACTFSYPSPEKCHVARANRKGCPVFYVADGITTALKEASCEAGQVVYLSEWIFANPKNAGFVLFFGEQLPGESIWQKAQKHQLKLLKDRLRHLPEETKKQWHDLYNMYFEAFMGENYDVSSLIGHYLLYETEPSGVNLLVYPSRANEAVSFNLAIHPDFVDEHLQLKRVIKLRITQKEPQISPRVLSVGDMDNGTVIWRAPLENEEKIES